LFSENNLNIRYYYIMDDKIIADVTQMQSNSTAMPQPISDMKYNQYLLTNDNTDEFNDDFDKNQYLNIPTQYLNEYKIEGFENVSTRDVDATKMFVNVFVVLFIILLLYILWDIPKEGSNI